MFCQSPVHRIQQPEQNRDPVTESDLLYFVLATRKLRYSDWNISKPNFSFNSKLSPLDPTPQRYKYSLKAHLMVTG
jgi:hypothetical protein